MPKIQDAFTTKTVSLPSYEDSELHIKTAISVKKVMSIEQDKADLSSVLGIVCELIVKWNFEKEDGTPLEITVENLEQFPSADLMFLSKEVQKMVKKKQLPNTK